MIAPNETSSNICVLRAIELPSFGSIVMRSSSLLTIIISSLSTRAFTIHSSLFTVMLAVPGAPWGRTCRCCRRPTWSRTSWPSSRWPWGSPTLRPCRSPDSPGHRPTWPTSEPSNVTSQSSWMSVLTLISLIYILTTQWEKGDVLLTSLTTFYPLGNNRRLKLVKIFNILFKVMSNIYAWSSWLFRAAVS